MKPLPPLFSYSACTLFEALSDEQVAAQMTILANADDPLARQWLERCFPTADPTKRRLPPPDPKARVEANRKLLLREIVDACPQVGLVMIPCIDERNRGKWTYAYDETGSTKQGLYALAMFRIVKAGLLSRIRPCQLTTRVDGRWQLDCNRYKFGDTRSVWCSSKCASKGRMRRQRWKEGK